MSEVIPQDEDRGGGGAIEGATGEPDVDDVGGVDEEPGAGPDDGGPGSQNL